MPFYGIVAVVLTILIIFSLKSLVKGNDNQKNRRRCIGGIVALALFALIGPYNPARSVKPVDNVVMCEVDFSKDEYAKRFHIETIGYTGYCASGSGSGFSNRPGSHCSSLGLYRVTGTKTSDKVGRALLLEGLSSTNSNARRRGILVHSSRTVSNWRYGIKRKTEHTSEGCFTVDSRTLDKLMTLQRRGMKIYIIAHK